MACAFFRSALDHECNDMIRCALVNKSVAAGSECVVWTSPTDVYGYGIYQVTSNGKRLKLVVHQLMFFLENIPLQLCNSMHDSYIYHNNLCVNIDHLWYEPASVNNVRKVCRQNGDGTGHRAMKRCLFPESVTFGKGKISVVTRFVVGRVC